MNDYKEYLQYEKCKTCERYDVINKRQRNKIYCTFSCIGFQEECLKAAHAYNEAVTGDPNIYGLNGEVW